MNNLNAMSVTDDLSNAVQAMQVCQHCCILVSMWLVLL